jgi:integrase
MHLSRAAWHPGHVIPVTPSPPNHHTRATIRIADACHGHARPIATQITLNTGSAKTRHTAAYRMAEDSSLPLTDVQFVLGHAQLTTTQIYLTPRKEEVIRRVLAHHAEQTRQAAARSRPSPAQGYRPETLDVLFRNGAS